LGAAGCGIDPEKALFRGPLMRVLALSVVEIAQQAGHSPAMMLATYAHVIEELAGTQRLPAEAVIRDEREKLVSEMCPPARHQRRH
jgi:hypothetical protein